MSTLRISNIEAKSVPASATIDEKIKITNSSGDTLVFIDGKTSGITTVGINTTDSNITFDANSNVVVTGIITATRFSGQITPTSLEIGSNIKLGNAGVITATSFVGSGANLTSLPAQVTIANNADNRVITGGSGVNLNGEANLTFNGNTLSVTGTTNLYGNGGASAVWGNTGYIGHLSYDGSSNAVIRAANGKALIFQTDHTNDRLRIGSSGETTLFRLNTFPNPNNTGSEILGGKLVFGSNISLEERYPNGAYVDRQDLVLRTNTGYGQGLSDKIRFTAGGTINFETSGGGLNFGAMSNVGGMTSETLDDYEEGDHTTSVTMTGDTSFTYVSRVLTYTKIGRVVHVTGRLHMYGCSGSTFEFTLPFTSGNGNKFETSNEMQNIRFNDDYTFRIAPNTAVARLQNDGGTTGIGADNIHINVNLTYFT